MKVAADVGQATGSAPLEAPADSSARSCPLTPATAAPRPEAAQLARWPQAGLDCPPVPSHVAQLLATLPQLPAAWPRKILYA